MLKTCCLRVGGRSRERRMHRSPPKVQGVGACTQTTMTILLTITTSTHMQRPSFHVEKLDGWWCTLRGKKAPKGAIRTAFVWFYLRVSLSCISGCGHTTEETEAPLDTLCRCWCRVGEGRPLSYVFFAGHTGQQLHTTNFQRIFQDRLRCVMPPDLIRWLSTYSFR